MSHAASFVLCHHVPGRRRLSNIYVTTSVFGTNNMQIKFESMQAGQVISTQVRRSFVFLKDEHKKTTWGKSKVFATLTAILDLGILSSPASFSCSRTEAYPSDPPL